MTLELEDPAAPASANGVDCCNRQIISGCDDNSPRATSATAADALPRIELKAGVLHEIATEAEAALLTASAPFYVRGAELVRPVVEELDADKGRKTAAARLVAVTADALVDRLSRTAVWEKYDGRKGRLVPADPPCTVAKTILSRDGEWRFRRLVGLITTPTLRPDGTVLDAPGYDAATGLLLVNPPAMPRLAPRPTRKAAEQALDRLDGLLSEFPFVDDASRSVALSALITPVVRGAMPVVPLHAMRAPTPGSGKSFLVDLAAAIATGQRCPVIAAGRTEDENQKRLGAALLAGQPLVSLDNLNGELSGDTLCQMVERPVVEVRPLGKSELVKVESRATMFANGNNLVIVGDMVRRVVLCSLDAELERPELRRFGSDPFAKVLADRGAYIAAALTIVRAYIGAGCPGPRPALASFEAWSRLVRSALCWLGRADPVETMDAARAEDPEMGGMREIFTGWRETIGADRSVSASDVLAAADAKNGGPDDAAGRFREALTRIAGDGHSISPVKLGHYLKRRKNRIVSKLKVVSVEDTHSKAMRWRLIEC